MVYKDHFTTDHLTRGEAIRLGHALAKNPGLATLGKTVQTFRLFDGRNVDTEEGEKNSGTIKKTIHLFLALHNMLEFLDDMLQGTV